MKKFITGAIVFAAFFCATVKAQQKYIAEAVLQPGGLYVLKLTDPSGKTTTISGKTNAEIQAKYADMLRLKLTGVATATPPDELNLFVPHQAVLLENGSQEIHWTDASGKVRVVNAAKGESIQEKYWAYLKREGLPCGCTPPAAANSASQNSEKTATRQLNKQVVEY